MEKIILQGDELYAKKALLRKVRTDNTNWKIYYIDDITEEKWVEEYLHSELHGGGAPQLRLIEEFPWE